MCLRVENREYLAAKTAGFKGLPKPYDAEALGLREAIMWFGDMNLTSLCIELDGKPLLNTIKLFKLDDHNFVLNWAV